MRVRNPVLLPLGAAVLATALLLAVGVSTLGASNRTVLDDARVRVRSNRDAAIRALNHQVDDFERTVSAFATAPRVVDALARPTPGARAGADLALGTLARSKSAPGAFLSDLAGRTTVTYPAQPELIGRSFAYRDWFAGVSRTGRPYVSTAYRTAASGRPLVVAVSTPVLDGSRRVGYLTLLWQLDAVRNLARGARRDDSVVISVTDQSGQPLTDPSRVDGRGPHVSPSVAAITSQALAGRTLDVVDSTSVAAAGPVPGVGWTATAVLPRTLALAPAAAFRRSLELTLGASWFLVLVVLVMAIRLSRRRVREQATVEEQRSHLSALFAASPIGIMESDVDGTIVAANRALAQLLGYEPEDLVGRNALELIDSEYRDAAREDVQLLLEAKATDYTNERVFRARDGGVVPTLVSTILIRDHGSNAQLIAFVVDQAEQKAAVDGLRASDERFRRIFDEALIGKLLVNTEGKVVAANATIARMFDCERDDLVGSPLLERFDHSTDHRMIGALLANSDNESRVRAEMALTSTDGRPLWGLVAMSWLVEREGQRNVLVQIEDITARRVAEQRLKELALHDELTGLANRRLLLERCERAFTIARSNRTSKPSVAVLFIDLDGFKPVNDHGGHAAGDQLLREVADDLSAAVRPTDTVARVGGDEFVVLLEQVESRDFVRRVAERITATVRREVDVGNTRLTLSASVGVAVADPSIEGELHPDQLLRRADTAMYRAKERGRDRHDLFDAELEEDSQSRHLVEQAVRDGLRDDRITMVFQTIMDVDGGDVVGAEALMRLTAADGRLVPTRAAVVAAEGAGLAPQLGERTLDLALAAASAWPDHMSLALNVSGRHLTHRNLRQQIKRALAAHGFDPGRLILEITESSIRTAGPSALADLQRLREEGVRVAIDDFGTAYATLANLTALPVDILKVDAVFTAGLPSQRAHVAVLHGIASIAFELGIPCVVKGVETHEQLTAITGMGVLAQGWYWGQPKGADHIPAVQREVAPASGGADSVG